MQNHDSSVLMPGLKGSCSFTVEPEKLAPAVGSGEVPVLATPMLIAGMEEAAYKAVANALPENHTTVGVHMDVYHTAPSPEGTTVKCEAELVRISKSGKKLYFDVKATDIAGSIGYGAHERVIIEKDSFQLSATGRKSR